MSFVGSLIGGIMGSGAASDAAAAEQQAAKQAQNTIESKAQSALDFQNNIWSGTQAAEQPYQQLGASSAHGLEALLGTGFQAPTLAQAEATPGYQFQLEQGTNAINQNAAATGTLMSGNTGAALQRYGQGLASTSYQQIYNNALQSYLANLQGLTAGTGMGLTSTGQLGQFGQAAAGNESNVNMNAAQMEANQINNTGAARASGYMGGANAWSNAFGGMAGGLVGGFGNLDTTGGSSPWEQFQNFGLGALAG